MYFGRVIKKEDKWQVKIEKWQRMRSWDLRLWVILTSSQERVGDICRIKTHQIKLN